MKTGVEDIFSPILNYISAYIQAHTAPSADKTALWLALFILFLIIYFMLIWFFDISKSTAVAIAFMPVLILDLSFSFGSYVFKFPLDFTYNTTKGVVTLNLIDWIFNFGIFKRFGLETFNQVSGTVVLTSMQNALVYIFVFADIIILYILLAYILSQIFENPSDVLAVALIPTIAYAYFTNPLKELAIAKGTVIHILYFLNHASPIQMTIVVVSAPISFLLVVFLISTVTNLFVSVGKSTIKPGLEASTWAYSITGQAFGLSLVYATAAILHPEYAWYVALPFIIVYNVLRSSLSGHAEKRRTVRSQKTMIREAFEEMQR